MLEKELSRLKNVSSNDVNVISVGFFRNVAFFSAKVAEYNLIFVLNPSRIMLTTISSSSKVVQPTALAVAICFLALDKNSEAFSP